MTFFLWVFEIIRTRNISLFKYVNPGIELKGLIDTSKWRIYQKLPIGSYPKTVRIEEQSEGELINAIARERIGFPLIVKPEYGYRGIGVAKITTEKELAEYAAQAESPFLVQELVDFPLEAGIFYMKHPEQIEGEITSIAAKEFLSVKGDGEKTINDLLSENPRGLIQLERLDSKVDLNRVPQRDEDVLLEEIGSHNLGTRFYEFDQSPSDLLAEKIEEIASQMDGFYYGRFDVRFESWEQLQKGEGFQIIEVNDVISEPTHMYDQKYGYWFAIWEVFRYHKKMFSIARYNYNLAKREEEFKKKSLITT
ncbi:MAG: D-alanine--D-alanine ligase [Bacteroidota bacterium]